MKRFIQQTDAVGAFYAGNGVWTRDIRDALDFKDSLSAIQCCVREGLYGVQLVIRFDNGGSDVRLPVLPKEAAQQRFQPRGMAV